MDELPVKTHLNFFGRAKIIDPILNVIASETPVIPANLTGTVGGVWYSSYYNSIMTTNADGDAQQYIKWEATDILDSSNFLLINAGGGNANILIGDGFVKTSSEEGVSIVDYIVYDDLDSSLVENTLSGSEEVLSTSYAIKEYVDAQVSSITGAYLPLAGGTLTGVLLMSGSNQISFGDNSKHIVNSSGGIGIYAPSIHLGAGTSYSTKLTLTTGAIYPSSTGTIDLGKSGTPFKNLYLNTVAYVPEVQNSSGALTLRGAGTNDKITLDSSAITVYSNVLPTTTNSLDLGSTSKVFNYGYIKYVVTSNLTLASTTVTSIATSIDSTSYDTKLPTQLAVKTYVDGLCTVATTSIDGFVTQLPASSGALYYLAGDNAWYYSPLVYNTNVIGINSNLTVNELNLELSDSGTFVIGGKYTSIIAINDGTTSGSGIYIGYKPDVPATIDYSLICQTSLYSPSIYYGDGGIIDEYFDVPWRLGSVESTFVSFTADAKASVVIGGNSYFIALETAT